MQIPKIRGVLHRFKVAVLLLVPKKRKLLPVDGATAMKMVWACFDHPYFDKMLGIAFVFYSVPVYFNPAGGWTSLQVLIITRACLHQSMTIWGSDVEFVVYIYRVMASTIVVRGKVREGL
jgi:hypothetical protein